MDLKEFWKPYVGAVSLTFDDGTDSQLQEAIPTMNKLGIKGTFYIRPKTDTWREDMQPWMEVARDGHELGNHTLSHICSNNFSGGRNGLEDISLAEIEADILAAQERLVHIAPHQSRWTYAYPCYQTYVAQGASRQSYVPVIARHFLCGRARGEYGFANYPACVDLACVSGIPAERMSGYEMIGLVEELTSNGRWVILVFHEISGSRLTVGSYDFKMLLDYLHRRSREIWTAPVVEVAGKIAHFQTAHQNRHT